MSIKNVKHSKIKETYDEAVKMLKSCGKCVIIRPTGFGKTFIMANIAKKYKKVLYIYPTEIIKIDIKETYSDVMPASTAYMTYSTLGNMGRDGDLDAIRNAGYDLVILDELHCAGGNLRRKAFEELLPYFEENGVHLLGASGTPDRSDGYDVVHYLFGDNVVSEFGLHEAIQARMMPKLHYVYSLYNLMTALEADKAKVKKVRDAQLRDWLDSKFKALEVEISKKLNVSNVIKEHIEAVHGQSVDYVKFIVFFSMHDTLTKEAPKMVEAFQQAYPNMKVRTLRITSNAIDRKNLAELPNHTRTPGCIDLIFCVDMLNMGYHIDDITGVVLMRGTKSSIVYNQQVGRSLSVKSKIPPIIFDFANNLHQDYYFQSRDDSKKRNKDNVNVEVRQKRNRKLSNITTLDLDMDDKIAVYKAVVEKIDRAITEDTKNYILKMWDESSAPIQFIQAETGVAFRKIQEYLFKTGRIDAQGNPQLVHV